MDQIFDENQPIYLQIKYRLYARIVCREFKSGDKLPGVIDAAMFYRVNHNTIQRVYQEMVREGVAVTRRGEGTFVTDNGDILEKMRQDILNTTLADFLRQMRLFGAGEEEIIRLVQKSLGEMDNQRE